MSKVLVTESHLNNIAEAIREKNGASTTYRPGDMAAAIQAIPTGITPTGAKNITQNGTHDVTQYASANVNVQPNLQSKTATENGTVTPDQGYDGLSSVVVNVSGGGGDVTLLTRSAWDALTTAQKQAYGLVAIQDANSGFERGILVYGADYKPIGFYLPYSDETKVICEAYVENYGDGNVWGDGNSPITLMSGLNPSKDTSENAIYLPCAANGPACAYVDLGSPGTPFTAYIVMKLLNPAQYTRILSVMNQRTTAQGMLLYGSNINVGSWANDTPTGISSSNYFAAAIQFAGSGSGFGVVHGGSIITKAPSTAGRYVTIARTDPGSDITNAEPGNAYVRYLAVVNEAESQATVTANLANLANEFLS